MGLVDIFAVYEVPRCTVAPDNGLVRRELVHMLNNAAFQYKARQKTKGL